MVDWDRVFEEGSRLYGIVRARHKLREAGTPHAEIVKQQPTGYHYLDHAHHSSPSIAGDAVRRVLYRKETGADPPWHEPAVLRRVHRRMSERSDGGKGPGSHLRRLGVAFFEATVAAPFAFSDTLMPSGITVQASEISFFEAILRYLVSSTVGCYFVAPAKDQSDTQGDEGTQDGDRMFVMRPSEEKLCFPGVSNVNCLEHQQHFCVASAMLRTHARSHKLQPPFVCAVSVRDAADAGLPRPHAHAGRRRVRAQLPRLLPRRRLGHADHGRQHRGARHQPALRERAAAQRGHPARGGSGRRDHERGRLRLDRRAQHHERRPHPVLKCDIDATQTPFCIPTRTALPACACAVCQLGGLIYFTLLGIIVLVLINFLPLVNLVFQLMFDGCVACVDAATVKKRPGKAKKPASLSKAPSKRVKGTSATGESASADVSNVNLTAQQLRSFKRRRRLAADGSDPTSFTSRARALGKRVAQRFGGTSASVEQASLLPSTTESPVSPPAPPDAWA